MEDCPYHSEHEYRIKSLEKSLEDIKGTKVNPAVWVGLFSFLATIFTTAGSLLGIVISHYFK